MGIDQDWSFEVQLYQTSAYVYTSLLRMASVAALLADRATGA